MVSAGTSPDSPWCEKCGYKHFTSKKVCKVCTHIRKTRRAIPCEACQSTNCDALCTACGIGYHTRCAEANGYKGHEDFTKPKSEDKEFIEFTCKGCEEENFDEDTICGRCTGPFAHRDDPMGGFKLNQQVLVQWDTQLYVAIIVDTNEREEKIRIHYNRWSKSFDRWVSVDDDLLVESLSCDCCYKWFHIACCPPFKNTGHYENHNFLCTECLDGVVKDTPSTSKSKSSSKKKPSKSNRSFEVPKSVEPRTKRSRSDASLIPCRLSAPTSERRKAKGAGIDIPPSTPNHPTSRTERISSEPSQQRHNKGANPLPETRSRLRRLRSVSAESPRYGSRQKHSTAENPIDGGNSVKKKSAANQPAGKDSSIRKQKRVIEEDEEDEPPVNIESRNDSPAQECTDGSTSGESTSDVMVESFPVENKEMEKKHDTTKKDESMADVSVPATPPISLTPQKNTRTDTKARNTLASLLNSPREIPDQPRENNSISRRIWDSVVERQPECEFSTRDAADFMQVEERVANVSFECGDEEMDTSLLGQQKPCAFDILRAVAAQSITISNSNTSTVANNSTSNVREMIDKRNCVSMPISIPASMSMSLPVLRDNTKECLQYEASMVNIMPEPSVSPDLVTVKCEKEAVKYELGDPADGEKDMSEFGGGAGVSKSALIEDDVNFQLREEIYLRFCQMEDEGYITKEEAQNLRLLTQPTSGRFEDVKFVYLVNRHLPGHQLGKRIAELCIR